MRSNRSIRLGVALAGGAIVLLVLYLIIRLSRAPQTPVTAEATPAPGLQDVSALTGGRTAIALVDMPARSIITPDMFRMEELPEGAVGINYVTDPEAQAVGFITRRRILRNERLRSSDLVGHISEVGIAGALQPNTRAMVVPIPSKPTLHDLVRVGDYVDVVAAFDQQESRTIVERVRVLAVDVFGKDYPPTSVAVRGPYKAPQRSIRGANPPAPPTAAQPATQPAPQAGQPAPAPTPTPTPAPAQAPPAPALTLEVTPDQANRISLAQNSGAALDFLIVPPPFFTAPGAAPGAGEVRAVFVTRAQIAPYAERKKSAGAAAKTSGGGGSGAALRPSRGGYSTVSDSAPPVPSFPEPAPVKGGSLPPAGIGAVSGPTMYEIPIYADGKKIRTDVVPKPNQ